MRASNSPGAFQNAGRGHAQVPIEELSLDAFTQVINVNLIGTFLCTREAVRIFKAQSPQGGAPISSFMPLLMIRPAEKAERELEFEREGAMHDWAAAEIGSHGALPRVS